MGSCCSMMDICCSSRIGSCCSSKRTELKQEDVDFLLRHTTYTEEEIRDFAKLFLNIPDEDSNPLHLK